MDKKRILSWLLAPLCAASLGISARAAQVDSGSIYCFSAGDFSQDSALSGICITSLPESASGTVKLGARILRPGDILTAKQLDQITFSSLKTEEDQQVLLTYLPIYPDRVEATAVMHIDVLGKQDLAPVAEDSAIETYKNLPNEALLKVKDPEGQPLTFTLTRPGKRGDVVLREDGSFHYTPKKNKLGIDSFTYTATDPAGNVSREATVTVTILKPTSDTPYTDTTGKSCRFAAEWMKNTGLFIGESLGGNNCFGPEKQVSTGEFISMMVSALQIPLEENASQTAYTADTPHWLQPYLAAALRSGLTNGWPAEEAFAYDAPITGGQAAVLLHNALDLPPLAEDTQTLSDAAASTPNQNALQTLSSYGIELTADSVLTRADTAEVLYAASRLTDKAPGLLMLRAAQ